MILKTLAVGSIQANCFILGSDESHEAVVIDPGDEAPKIEEELQRAELHLNCVLATHAHFDHILGARELCESTGAPFYLHDDDLPELARMKQIAKEWLGVPIKEEPPLVNAKLLHGEWIEIGEIRLEIRHTPGHSPGSVALVDHQHHLVFTGDALFAGSIGRTDLAGGDFLQLLASIRQQILTLPDDFVVLPGHGPSSTVGEERSGNPFLTGNDADYWH